MALHMVVDPLSPSDRAMVLAAEVLQAGGVVVYPTETLYGLGVNAWSVKGLARVRAIKQREEARPILVLVHDEQALAGLTDGVPEAARVLMARFWPGPMTIVFPAAAHLPAELTSGRQSIGVRISSSPLCRRLTELCGYPITSTSANISGSPAPNSAADIERALGPGVDMYLDGGMLSAGLPSTVVDVTGSRPRVVREGAIPVAEILPLLPNLLV
jgi:L-threonylcarbamoyladenylate synthase